MRPGHICRLGAIAGRMACILAVVVLTCVSVAYGQVIEEGGFPVKGGGVSGEPFSLSCPPRLVAHAGESVLLSCSATAAPEEGVRYEWESLSGDGLHLLSDANERSPLFTAPLSGESGEYVYRLTAMSVGVYETAAVTVIVGGVSGETVSTPVVQEGCDSLADFEGGGRGECLPWNKAPPQDPFGGIPEDEGIVPWPSFPGSPGAEEKEFPVSSGEDSAFQTPPYLDCPVAVFLEELETGSIECHVSDAAGEEFLEYSWESVGGTTRDYLENPKLIPEDAPDPSVVAPEAPVYETLESFRSGERTFRYRYRLTATSRATGLSSSSEVEVFVSGSRPSVYCPLEIVVEEGETITLDCEGADPLSFRMDYNEESASVLWEWEGLWGTSTAPLAGTELSSPLFTAPLGSAGEEYHYIASMTSSASGLPRTARRRVTVKVTGGEEVAQQRIRCSSSREIVLWEGDPDHEFACRLEPNGINVQLISVTWHWTGSIRRLSATNIPDPVFDVPGAGVLDRDQVYTLRLYANYVDTQDRGETWREFQLVVKNRALTVTCDDPSDVNEGSPAFDFSCSATGPPDAPPPYTWSWSPTDNLTDHHTATPTFAVPDDVDGNTTYTYKVTANTTTDGLEDGTAEITVTVKDKPDIVVACASPLPVYEGSDDITFDCAASGAPEGSAYTYAWTERGGTPDTSLLSSVDIASPTFYVPGSVPGNETYEYTLTVSADDTESGFANVTVTVLNKPSLTLVCTPPAPVYEGAADLDLDCSASGAPEGSAYEYAWTARGDTPDTSLLSSVDIASPTFYVPEELDATTTYEYLVRVSAANAESSSANVTVMVLNKPSLTLVCMPPALVYEGAADFDLDCSASGAPSGSDYVYEWTARGSTTNTAQLSETDGPTPTFDVPGNVNADTDYEYTVRVSAANAESSSANVTVMVLNRGALALVCADPGSVYEGREDIALDCSASGAPEGSAYEYAWTARGDTPDTSLLSSVDIASPTFYVPEELDATTTYKYLVRVSAANAESSSANVTVRVLNKPSLTLVCTPPALVYEGAADFDLDCSASGAPEGSAYEYAWTARGDTPDTSLLSSVDIASPTFYVLEELDATTTYKYLVRVSAANAESSSANVTVMVLNKPSLTLVCTPPALVYEGAADFDLDCSASGAPEGSAYEYAWTARGDTPDTSLLSSVDIASPTFYVPEELDATTTYEYLVTVSAANAESSSANVTVTVLNRGALALVCADPGSVYEGREDIALDCSASGAPEGSAYEYAWTARGDTPDTSLLSSVDIASPTFYVPEELDATTTYEYLVTVSAANAESSSANVTVRVLNKPSLTLVCTPPALVYEGVADFDLDCSASGAPEGSAYEYAWTARGDTPDTSLLSSVDIASPTFYVLEELDATTTYKYLVRVSAANAESSSARVTVTVLNRGALAVVCAAPGSVYEGSADIVFDCSASGAPSGSAYAYAWAASGDTQDTSLLSATDIASPTFYVPEELDATTTYEYLVRVSAANAESSSAEVTVTVLNRIQTPDPESVSPPLASSSLPESSLPSSLGVTVSTSSLRFGVQSSDTEVSLDPMTDHLSTRASGPYHAGRMTLSLDGSGEVLESGEMDLSVEIVSPVTLRREGGIEVSLLVLSPRWSYAESCDHLSSQLVGGLYTEVTLSEGACRLLRFGGELGLTDVPSGRYAGSMDVVLRSGKSEETHTVAVDVTVIPAQRVVTIGPGGVRFSTSRELPAGLTEEQNLSIYPDVAFLTEEKPHGVFELSNPSLIPLEVTVSARFGYTEATEDGREVVVEDTLDSRLGDLSQVVDIHPNVLVLQPGEKGLVRYGMQEGALAAVARGYAAFFDVVSEPRQYVRSDQMPEEVSGDRTARVTMRVPGVYVPGEGASQLRAALSSISFVGSLSATFLLETQDHPFVGEVVAYDGDGRELGRRETLVYTRSHVRVPLDRMPEAGTVFLHFIPRGSDRVPEPGSIEWNAPARDIGDAGNKDGATTTATLVQKP